MFALEEGTSWILLHLQFIKHLGLRGRCLSLSNNGRKRRGDETGEVSKGERSPVGLDSTKIFEARDGCKVGSKPKTG
jgi:hypothetical protein